MYYQSNLYGGDVSCNHGNTNIGNTTYLLNSKQISAEKNGFLMFIRGKTAETKYSYAL
jgi:hypothetical protein